jgi:DNA-binding GntR family transcriptional regulator
MNAADFLPSRESDKVEEELRRLILTMELAPGLAISESALMKRFDWGRTPLREAFQRLAGQSLLQIIPHHGIVITPLSVFDFVEMMDAMGMVVGTAASLACKRLTEADLDRLEQIVCKAEKADAEKDFIQVAELDFQFHEMLAEATGNRYLSEFLLHLHQVATRFNFASWQRDGSALASLRDHHRIIETLRSRDPVDAKATMLEHIEGARQRVMRGMDLNQEE